ncbi:MAG: glutamate 5-kinase, partial [Gammaproteobacteria bacterium]
LYDRDPREFPEAKLVREGEAGDPELLKFAGKAGDLGRGGMQTKLKAAALAANSGASTVIAAGLENNVLERIADGESIGTLLTSRQGALTARKQWLAGRSQVHGCLVLDAGAVKVLRHQGKSLLAAGVKAVEGDFRRGEIVSCLDENRAEVARGLVNYGASETRKIMGKSSDQFAHLLGYIDEPELIHRDNLILV